MIRPDFIFSYWIFAWYLLYFFKIINIASPKFALILAIIENLFILALMFYYNTKLKLRLIFVIIMFIIKIIPLYTIWNDEIDNKNINITIVIFICYLFWMLMNNETINNFIHQTKEVIIHNKKILPGMVFIDALL